MHLCYSEKDQSAADQEVLSIPADIDSIKARPDASRLAFLYVTKNSKSPFFLSHDAHLQQDLYQYQIKKGSLKVKILIMFFFYRYSQRYVQDMHTDLYHHRVIDFQSFLKVALQTKCLELSVLVREHLYSYLQLLTIQMSHHNSTYCSGLHAEICWHLDHFVSLYFEPRICK